MRSLNALGRGKFPHTSDAVERAIAIAKEIDLKLKASSFSWQNYPQWLPDEFKSGNPVSEKPKTISEWIEEYEQDFWSTRECDRTKKQYFRNQEYWRCGYLVFLRRIPDWTEHPSKEIFDKACASYPKSWKRNECCTVIKYFARFCGLHDYDPQKYRITRKQVEVKAKPKREMTDIEIEQWYEKFPEWVGRSGTPSEWQLWQWMYGMQAAYGFRNHEVLNVYNLDREYMSDDGNKYPSFIDPVTNPRGSLA